MSILDRLIEFEAKLRLKRIASRLAQRKARAEAMRGKQDGARLRLKAEGIIRDV